MFRDAIKELARSWRAFSAVKVASSCRYSHTHTNYNTTTVDNERVAVAPSSSFLASSSLGLVPSSSLRLVRLALFV